MQIGAKPVHKCHACHGLLDFLLFDPGDGGPVWSCHDCGLMHVGNGCCWEPTPKLEDWLKRPRSY